MTSHGISSRHLIKKSLPFYIALISASVTAPSFAQEMEKDESKISEEIIVTGMRASVQSAQQLKRDSAVVQDSIVAEDIGKLPDRSIAEALQRIPGITVSRFDTPKDPEHFAGQGAGVSIRGLTQVRSELNGRDIFSAKDGRSLSFEDVPAELMAGVDVYKSPTADMVEGGLGGIVNLRTRMPLDKEGQLISSTLKFNYGDIIDEVNPEGSILYSNNWETGIGRIGVLVDLSKSKTSSRADTLYNRAYFPRTSEAPFNNALEGEKYADETYYTPRGSDWRRNDYANDRGGQYLALQWQPSDSIEIYATGFRSEATRQWFENAFFIDAGGGFPDYLPVPSSQPDDWVFDENNTLVSGTVTAPKGVPFGTSSRLSTNESETVDFSTGMKWSEGAWTINADFQRVISSSTTEDFTLGTVAFPKTIRFEGLNSESPKIYDVNDVLSDVTNYSFGQMMSQPKDNHGDSTAIKFDVKYDFEDSIIKSVKSGVRYSEREANNRSSTNWTARVQPWSIGSWPGYPTISDNNPLMQEFSFEDFQRGNADVPVSGWMFTPEALADFRSTTEAMIAQSPTPADATWVASSPDWNKLDLDNPSNKSNQKDKTSAAYVKVDFDVSDSVDGNVGVRYVTTSVDSIGYVKFPTFTTPSNDQPFYVDPNFINFSNDYSFTLPSLNLRYMATDELMFRFSASKQIWKPEFWRTEAIQEFKASWNDTTTTEQRNEPGFVFDPSMVNLELTSNDTNPELNPMTAMQYDITTEWYFDDNGGMLYAGLFSKKIEDIFRIQTAAVNFEEWTIASKRVINIGSADVKGIEVGGTYYFDFLPAPFNGLGASANYTYIDSSSDVPANQGTEPIDADGLILKDDQLEGLAKNTYNVTVMYEYSGFYSRLAYNWHNKVFQNIGPNGWNGENYSYKWKLPVYEDAYGQLDFSMGYNVTENFSVNFEATNLLKEDTKGIMRQGKAGDHTAYVYTNDVRYALSFRATY